MTVLARDPVVAIRPLVAADRELYARAVAGLSERTYLLRSAASGGS